MPGTEYTLTLGGGSFRGLAVLPLHDSNGGAVTAGTNARSRTCTNRAAGITHSQGTSKTSASGTWTAPADAEAAAAAARWEGFRIALAATAGERPLFGGGPRSSCLFDDGDDDDDSGQCQTKVPRVGGRPPSPPTPPSLPHQAHSAYQVLHSH